MDKNKIINDRFHKSTCGVCCTYEVNQYFSIDNNFIDYNKSLISFRKILSETLDFDVSLLLLHGN